MGDSVYKEHLNGKKKECPLGGVVSQKFEV